MSICFGYPLLVTRCQANQIYGPVTLGWKSHTIYLFTVPVSGSFSPEMRNWQLVSTSLPYPKTEPHTLAKILKSRPAPQVQYYGKIHSVKSGLRARTNL